MDKKYYGPAAILYDLSRCMSLDEEEPEDIEPCDEAVEDDDEDVCPLTRLASPLSVLAVRWFS